VVAEQIPTKLVPDVIKNTALKVVHRLPAFDDRHQVGAAMNLDEDQSREVVSLRPGVAAVFADGMDRPLRVRVPLGEGRERMRQGPPPPIDGRRSAACGCECRSGRACTLYELREADLLAAGPEWAWLRVWTDVLVLAHVVNRPLPAVPSELGRAWSRLSPRLRECMLATVVEQCVARRSQALRVAYRPEDLVSTVARVAQRLLRGAYGEVESPPGAAWVIPQVRWLHEMDKLLPRGGARPDKRALAPPMDYPLAGLKQSAGTRFGSRLGELRRHPLSMELARNRSLACTAILGEDDNEELGEDLAVVAIGRGVEAQLRYVMAATRTGSWLDNVLSWPARLVDSEEPPPFAEG
jgi:hypothetical protein